MGRECPVCERPASKQCVGCRKIRYCSEKCQRAHWKRHIFDCKRDPSKPIITAYHLYMAVLKDEFPKDPDTSRDYGFDNAHTPENMSNLLGLYVGLIRYREVEPIDIHRWRKNGTLVQEIINAFEKESEYTKGDYYPWFLQNQHLLDPSWKPAEDPEHSRVLETWEWIGGNVRDTYQQHREIYEGWSTRRQECFVLYHLLRSGWHPSPELSLWVSFGFATCRDEWAERQLAAIYKSVILDKRCTLDEFCEAFETHNMLPLFRRYGLEDRIISMPYMKDFLEGPMRESVWDLKAYVYQELKLTAMTPSFRVDYGIINCGGVVTHL
jgi:hypothetical protein